MDDEIIGLSDHGSSGADIFNRFVDGALKKLTRLGTREVTRTTYLLGVVDNFRTSF
jgi:hypothetical protein